MSNLYDFSNPFMFDKCYPDKDLMDYNAEEAYEMGVNAGMIAERDSNRKLYDELIMAVGNKFESESRHETALRYIKQAENQDNPPSISTNTIKD